MKNSKKILSVLLTFIMTFSLMIGGLTTAFAVAPAAPTVTNTGYINYTNQTAYDITGTGVAGANVDVTITDSASVTTTVYAPSVTVDTAGNFSVPVNTSTLAEGTISITATQTDAGGNVSSAATASVTKDTIAPVITGVIDGGFYKTVSPAFTGGTATLNSVQYATNTPIAGDSAQVLVVTDAAGNVTTVNFTTDNTAPTAPTVDIVEGKVYDANGVTPNILIAPADATQTVTLDTAPYTGGAITIDGAHVLVITNTDTAGNTSSITVNFTVDAVVPTITLVGSSTVTVAQGSTYTDAGATASDNINVDITTSIVPIGTVDTATLGIYTITYNVSDAAGNPATAVTRTVNVIPAAPSVTADDVNNVILGADSKMEYSTDAGATWTAYNVLTPPTFAGDVTVDVRVAANATTGSPAGASTSLTFTTNPVTYASTDALTNPTVSVINGTVETDAIAALDQTVGVVGTSSETGTATIVWTIASYSATTAGDYTATGVLTLPAAWTGTVLNVTVTVTVQPATLSSTAITIPATKLIYTVGDTLDISGMEVTGTYSDGSTAVETITVSNVTGFDSSVPAVDQVLTITVGGKTATYTVTINAVDLAAYNTALAAVTQADYTVASWDAYQLIVVANVVTATNTQAEVDATTAAITTAQIDLELLNGRKYVSSITDNNILLVGDYAFDLSDPANNKYNSNNFLVAANTAYLNAGKYEVYFRIGDAWYDIVSDPTMITPISDLLINGDGLFKYMNMQ